MCVAVPMKIMEINGDEGIVDLDGYEKEVNLMLIGEIKIGDWVMVHAGFAIQKVNEEDAVETLEALKELGEKLSELG
jgi:hydrogenase expression/formation protein HypC